MKPGLRSLLLGLVLGLLVGACGATQTENDDLLTGRWAVTALAVANTNIAAQDVFVQLSTAESSLRVTSNCHSLFGSFTFIEDGTASFTVPGASSNECLAADQEVESALLAALVETTEWEQQEDRLVFRGRRTVLELSPVG